MADKYIYSTLSNDQSFVTWVNTKDARLLPVRQSVVLISGKANIMGKTNLVTPKGVLTTISEEAYKKIEKLPAFKRFVERGYITVESKLEDPDKVAKDMKSRDKSSQLTDDDIKKDGKGSTEVSTSGKDKK